MRRRELLMALAAGPLVAPVAARAQAQRSHRLALVHSGIPADQLTAAAGPTWVQRFFEALRATGIVEGDGLIVARYSAEGRYDRIPDLVREVVGGNPDAIVTNHGLFARAFKAATSITPIIAIMADPIRYGLVESLARPGGNLTGVSIDAGIDILSKRLQILKEAIAPAINIAFLGSEADWSGAGGQVLRETAGRLGLTLVGAVLPDASEAQIRAAFDALRRQKIEAVLLSAAGDILAHRRLIVELAASNGLPAMYPYRDFVELGGLMAYAPDSAILARDLAQLVYQILNGASPGELPIHQASKFELVINLKAAQGIGLSIPAALLARADEVIE